MYKLIAGPLQEPTTLALVKSWLKVEIADDDDLITSLIIDARELIEETTNQALFTQTWDLVIDELPDILNLQKTPLQSVTGIYYTDIDGVEYTEPNTNYIADTYNHRILLRQEKYYEGVQYVRAYSGWRIRFIAGETQYPNWSKTLTKRLVSHFYENRTHEVSRDLMDELLKRRVYYI